MKEYPSILRKPRYIPIYMFDKIDGSNIRAEWTKKRGFYKFGSRHVLLGSDNSILGDSIKIINEKFSEPLSKIFVDERYTDVVAFFEFWGHSSFAGQHVKEEEHFLALIDVSPYKKGILNPDIFINLFENRVPTSPCIFKGKFNKEIEDQIKTGGFPGVSFEGVVCKAKRDKPSNPPIMFKVKTNAWLSKLKNYCKDDVILYEKLM